MDHTLSVCRVAVVMRGVEVSGLPSLVIEHTRSLLTQSSLTAVAGFAGTVALISNLVSNVPAVMMYIPLIEAQPVRDHLWLLLAMASTLAGNLTIIGSVANLIVLEASKDEARISFWEYFKVGAPVTLLTILAGVLWIH